MKSVLKLVLAAGSLIFWGFFIAIGFALGNGFTNKVKLFWIKRKANKLLEEELDKVPF